jgi:Fe-S-cluster containining protein
MKACNQCGKCCIHYSDGGLSATSGEIDWWETHRPDIFEYVRDGEIWVSPVTGEPLTKCPWLEKVPDQEKYICGIYHDRPDDCKHYPVDIDQMIRDACEMLEPRDLVNPKKAQQTLDLLMSDSRPPLSR